MMAEAEYWMFPQPSVERLHDLNAHEKPPESIKAVYKAAQKKATDQQLYFGILHHDVNDTPMWDVGPACTPETFQRVCDDFLSSSVHKPTNGDTYSLSCLSPSRILGVRAIPGLAIYPALLPQEVQLQLLDTILHRDLSHPAHKTNVHLHYHVSYPRLNDKAEPDSFFEDSHMNTSFQPKDPSIHKPITIQQFLEKKLRWMTLGGQYDWTNKVYPEEPPPPFPPDLKRLLEGIFPMKAEAAIANVYSPGDTLSLHRDVSEEGGQPLVSISLGCQSTFVIGLDEFDSQGQPRIAILELRSGDAVVMSGKARYAWHGVSKVHEGTCPDFMANWPGQAAGEVGATGGKYEHWRGWMKGKRINLNVRQMFEPQQSSKLQTYNQVQ